ncbi:hypothetical protein N658DRAFT_502253 [Parathielavia hyrcaniae]|uniref:Uncharacterized protein n=1 Tax=Parathielavia hyrcaniae TaxID=113614 RepID=A0AAN6PSE0_9PEZI|nr:hypothetical protein N658DRAFT_502253 [Parathielavia hyrcaniae]
MVNLLPLLRNAAGLRRVVTMLAGTKEGVVHTDDLQMRQSSLLSLAGRGHLVSMTTLALKAVARTAPTVSFVHTFPGAVRTNLGSDVEGLSGAVFRSIFRILFFVVGPFVVTPFDEAGERHVFFATSARFREGGVPLPKDMAVARGTHGSGVYSIDNHAESAPPRVEQLFAKLREDGTAKKVWSDVEEQFVRVTGSMSI